MLNRILRFPLKHFNWFLDKKRGIKAYSVQRPIRIYEKYFEMKKGWVQVELEYHNKEKDDRYWRYRGWLECLEWLNVSEVDGKVEDYEDKD